MEQATNLFNAGLLMDTHPMVLGNDTLTDALNATLITMNGNEVILLNDMGNRRVDNAFLPAGYEPVGIKEYGGIIYVAAYNPITNKSQIGSFPSPERKISPDDIKSGLKGTFDFSSLEEYTTKDSLNYLNNDTILVPLTSNNVLHAGDKFVVYADGIDAIKSNITNYDNTLNGKIKSPKNKKYTLLLGILNSLNEFVDITKNLCRWKIDDDNKSYVVSYTNESDLYKFNDGYFIANSLPDIPTPDYSKSDLDLIKERLVITANTYSYKLIGPLYLKATLNHIQDFNYNIYGVKNGNNADLYIEGYITYNCPDWITPLLSLTGDDIFLSYELGTLSNNGWFDLKGIEQATGGNSEIINKEKEKISYDPNTNLYTVKVIKKYTKVKPVSGTTLINYIVAVKCNSAGNSDNIYLENLSAKGVIDISKLGSGEITLTGWRFYNTENNNTTLTYSFDAYPVYGREIKGLLFYFENVSDSSNNFTITNSSLYNGRVTINIDWTSKHIIERLLYRVTITDGLPNSLFSFIRWFLSTPLMNSCFSGNNFIQDYGNDSRVLDKLKVFLTSNLQATDDNKINYANDYIHDNNGGWIRKRGSDKVIHTEFKHTCNINIGINPITEIINKEYYPKYVEVTNQGSLRVTPNLGEFDTTDIRIFKNSEDSRIELDNFVIVSLNPTASSSRILGTIDFYDKFKSVGDDTKIITNPFGKVEDWIKYSIFSLSGTYPSSNLPLYGGIGLDCNSEDGPDDGHFVNIYYSSNKFVQMIRGDGAAPTSGGERIAKEIDDGKVIFSYNSIQDAVKSVFNDPSKVQNTSLFLYVFQRDPDGDAKWTNKMSYSSARGGTAFTTLKEHARVWWRTSYNDWAMFKQLLGRNEDFYQFIKENVFGSNKFSNLYYNFADSISCEKADLLIPNENCYSYNYPYTLKADLNIKGNFTTNPTISTGGESYKIICKNGEVSTGTEIKFTLGTPINVEDLNIEIVLKSLDKFEELVLDRISTLKEIDIVNGYTKDSKDDPLDINSFYILENGLLKKEESLPITITSDYSANPGYRGILYNKLYKNTASPRYDCMGDDDDDWTVVDYSNLFIVNL